MANAQRVRWGYIDTAGNVAIDFRFDHASQFHDGFAVVRLNGKLGFIDRSGAVVIEPQFGDESQPFFEGLAMVQAATGKCGYIDPSGRYVIQPVFDWAFVFSECVALVRVDGKDGYITKSGEYLIEPQYDYASNQFSEGYVHVSKGDESYYLDQNGQIAFGPIGAIGDFSEGVAHVWHDGGHALLRNDGTVVPVRDVDWLSDYFSHGRIEFSQSGRCGYLDRDGKVAIPPVYDEASTFCEGLAEVKTKGRWGYVDTNGTMVIEPRFQEASFFKGGLSHVNINGKACYINRRGDVVLRTTYRAWLPFSEGVTPVYVEGRGLLQSIVSLWARPRGR